MEKKKIGLVLEGGAMRGMYTAGVLDSFMDAGIEFDGIIGVSAGALFGPNFLSKQRGRVIRYNKKFNGDKNYLGIRPLLKEGNILSTEYAYELVPRKLDPFDDEAFMKSDIPFYVVATDMETGMADYLKLESVFEQMDYLRASGSMPFLAKPVEIDGKLYMDGAVADSIPFEWMLEQGYDEIVVILTRQEGYVKEPMKEWMVNLFYKKKHPHFARALRNRHVMYNGEVKRLALLEEEGKAMVLRPSEFPPVSRTEKDPEKLQALYEVGLKDGKAAVEKLKEK